MKVSSGQIELKGSGVVVHSEEFTDAVKDNPGPIVDFLKVYTDSISENDLSVESDGTVVINNNDIQKRFSKVLPKDTSVRLTNAGCAQLICW